MYGYRLNSKKCTECWEGIYWETENDDHIISCKNCPKLDVLNIKFSIPFGSPVRKCSTAAQEANSHSLFNKDLLEIGFGKHSIPRHLVTDAGGTWTGIEPMLPRSKKASFGRGGYGYAGNIPFPDCSFDIVTGIQSLEHWEEPLPDLKLIPSYAENLKEVHRVLKPGGSIYFDAPIHLHGHEITIQKWRENYEPLAKFPAPAGDFMSWEQSVRNYSQERLQDISKNRSVWLITIKAQKN